VHVTLCYILYRRKVVQFYFKKHKTVEINFIPIFALPLLKQLPLLHYRKIVERKID
jgi:hypothetical protein